MGNSQSEHGEGELLMLGEILVSHVALFVITNRPYYPLRYFMQDEILLAVNETESYLLIEK